MTIRIGLIDDHPVVVDGLTTVLDAIFDLAVVAAASTAAEGRALLTRGDIDVVLLDIRLPDGNGIDLLPSTGSPARPGVIVLSTFDTVQYQAAAIRHGAHGFLLKTAPVAEIVAAIRAVAAGGVAFTAKQLRAIAAEDVHLSDHERVLIRLVARSRTNDEIGAELGISTKTVESRLSRLFGRFGVSSRTELAVRAEHEGWLEPE